MRKQLSIDKRLELPDSHKQLRLSSFIDLMAMKLDRCQKQSLDKTANEVELEDVVNYGLMALTKLRNNL